MFVRPARPELKLRDPVTLAFLPEAGADVAPSTYWHRAILRGDAVVAPAPAPVVTVNNPIPDSEESA